MGIFLIDKNSKLLKFGNIFNCSGRFFNFSFPLKLNLFKLINFLIDCGITDKLFWANISSRKFFKLLKLSGIVVILFLSIEIEIKFFK